MSTLGRTKTAVVETRVSYKVLAGLLAHYERNAAIRIRTKSELVCFALEDFFNLLVQNNKVAEASSEEDAYRFFLERLGDANKGGRGLRALASQMLIEDDDPVLRVNLEEIARQAIEELEGKGGDKHDKGSSDGQDEQGVLGNRSAG